MSYFCPTSAQGLHEEQSDISPRINMVVSQRPKSMRHLATLILVPSRMKKILHVTDEQLCSMIMDSPVEASKELQDLTKCEKRSRFQRVSSARQCTLCDTSQKDLVKPAEDLKLLAITLKGGSRYQKVNFKVFEYISRHQPVDTQAVTLSITNSNWYISCSMEEDEAALHLESCSEEDLKVVSTDGNMDRFLFYKRNTGISMTTFESVKYSGWFIGTCDVENQPLGLHKEDSNSHCTTFTAL
uniref:Interleukin-1 n=1 Tax=Myripristis murdjan TaxID=586833 RepID=A0A667Z9N5_9TELE